MAISSKTTEYFLKHWLIVKSHRILKTLSRSFPRYIVVQILIGFNNENLKSDIGVNAERSEKQSSQSLALTSSNLQGEWAVLSLGILRLNAVSTKPQTEF